MSYKNITPIFNNKLDKLKFLVKKYKNDFEIEKEKGNEALQTFLKISTHDIDEVITDILTEIETVKMTERKKVNYAKCCKKLNSIKADFQLQLQDINLDYNKVDDFLDFYDDIDEKLRPQPKNLLSNSDELTKWFKDYIHVTIENNSEPKNESEKSFSKYVYTTFLLASGAITSNKKNNVFFFNNKEFKNKASLYKSVKVKHPKIEQQYIADTLNKSGIKNILNNNTILKNTIQYCEHENIEVLEEYRKKYNEIQ